MKWFDITDGAKTQMDKLLKKNPEKYAISLIVVGGGCAGFKYDFNYANEPNEDDMEQDFGKFKLWVCPMSAGYLDGMVISWQVEGLNEGFHFWNPMESSSCGCGVSVGF